MNDELKAIVTRMITAGEPEENIAIVIKNFKPTQSLPNPFSEQPIPSTQEPVGLPTKEALEADQRKASTPLPLKIWDAAISPVLAGAKGIVSGVMDLIPGGVAAGMAAGMGGEVDYENKVQMGNTLPPEEIQRRKSELLGYSDLQEQEFQKTMQGVPQTTSEIGGPIDAASYVLGKAGNVIGMLPAMVAGPVFPFLTERGEAYKGGVTEIEKATGLSRDEILSLDLDKTARENSAVSGAINAGLESLGTLTVFGRLIPKSVAGKLITKIFTSKIAAPIVGGLGEGGTEWLQSLDTKIASKLSAIDTNGNKLYKDVFEAVNAITPEEWSSMKEEFFGGAAGGGFTAGVGSLIKEKKPKTNPIVTAITKEENSLGVTPELAAMQDDLLESELQEPPNAVQIETAGQVPVQSETASSGEVQLPQPQAESQAPTQEGQEQVVYTFDKDGNPLQGTVIAEGPTTKTILLSNGNSTVRTNTELFNTPEEASAAFTITPTKPRIRIQGEGVPIQTPEQQEFTAATEAYRAEPTPENETRLKTAQQAIQPTAEPSTKELSTQQIKDLKESGPVATEGAADGTFIGRVQQVLQALNLDPTDPRAREVLALANEAPKNAGKFNELIRRLEDINGTATTTIKKTSLRDQLREVWTKGITLGVKDETARTKGIIADVMDIIKSYETTLPPRMWKSIVNKIGSINTKNKLSAAQLFDYVARVSQDAKAAEQVQEIEDLQDKIKSKLNRLPESHAKLLKPLLDSKMITDASDLQEVLDLLKDIESSQRKSVDPTRGKAVPKERLEPIARKVAYELLKAANDRRVNSTTDDLFADEKRIESPEQIEKRTLKDKILGLLPDIKGYKFPKFNTLADTNTVTNQEYIEQSLKNMTPESLEMLSNKELDDLYNGIDHLLGKNGYSKLADVAPKLQVANEIATTQNKMPLIMPGARGYLKSLIGPSNEFKNMSQLIDYAFAGMTDLAAWFKSVTGTDDLISGKPKSRDYEHLMATKKKQIRKEIEKKTKTKLETPANKIRLTVFGHFASKLKNVTDVEMLENARHNWEQTVRQIKLDEKQLSKKNKALGVPNRDVAALVQEMLDLFNGAKTIAEVNNRMARKYPAVKEYKDRIGREILQPTQSMAESNAQTVYGVEPQMYEDGTYWPIQTIQGEKESTIALDEDKFMGLGVRMPGNLIERLPKLSSTQAYFPTGSSEVIRSVAATAKAFYMGNAARRIKAFIDLDKDNGAKWFGDKHSREAFESSMKAMMQDDRRSRLWAEQINILRRQAQKAFLTGFKGALAQYTPGAGRLLADFGAKYNGVPPYNIWANGVSQQAAGEYRKLSSVAYRLARSAGDYSGDIAEIDKEFKSGIAKMADILDEVDQKYIAGTIPRLTFGKADESLASRSWTTAYIDYLHTKGIDVSDVNTNEFWQNEMKNKADAVRREARAAADSYVSTNLGESSSLETAPVFRDAPVLSVLIPFSKYIIAKSESMNTRLKHFKALKTVAPKQRQTAARRIAADYVELAIYYGALRGLILPALTSILTDAALRANNLEPESDEEKEKKAKSRTAFSLTEALPMLSGMTNLVLLTQMVTDKQKADVWNGLMEWLAKEEGQKSSEFREETELPMLPISEKGGTGGLLGVVTDQVINLMQNDVEEENGVYELVYKDRKGDEVRKDITADEAEVLDNGVWIMLLAMLGEKDVRGGLEGAMRTTLHRVKYPQPEGSGEIGDGLPTDFGENTIQEESTLTIPME